VVRNVGFLKYWTVAQIPNIIIALPVLFSSIIGTYTYFRDLMPRNALSPAKSELRNTPIPPYRPVSDPRLLPIHLHSLCQTLLLIFSAHTQIALRTAITNPVIYWNLANMSFDWGSSSSQRKMGRWGKVWVGWSVVWGAVGIVLWSGHYPPA
jgi:phosphatidylinositol glycan class V